MILSCSRALFVQPVLRMDQTSWNASHVAAFEFFGGVPARLVCDNLKTGVERPDLYDPLINPAYGELAAHYGTLIDPARARKPKDKPRIERPMPYIRDSFFAAASSPRWPRCRPRRSGGPRRYTGSTSTAVWMGRPRRRCSQRSNAMR
ncbi:hypothetical protein MSAR_20320 [Mycolicibacterium sarraceniae]|nr:hypothetical protein MSAR_16190 [Mycolicibacterium sarraceniae]BBY58896.1 hypothetical protein MSAR_20320 [Mycolicibacterium sarraceniae]